LPTCGDALGALAYCSPVIRVMLIDDQPPTRDGVSRLLAGQPDMRVVGSFRESRAAVRFAAREAPDVAIVDSTMPGTNGADLARRLRAVSPKTQLVLLPRPKEAAEVAAAVRAVYKARTLAQEHRQRPLPSHDEA
jgi:two-component system, NarL family, response regulator LiaR